jgi:hypothetical protein
MVPMLPDPDDVPVRFWLCRNCGSGFNDSNTFTHAGWLETQLSGLCEVCFDIIHEFPRKDEEDDDNDRTE